MQGTLFARAKVQQPRLRVEQVARPQLEQRLEQALEQHALVLLSAPAGYGKTVLLSRALSTPRPGWAVAWISIDEDDDLPRLIQALVSALEPYDLPWRLSPEALGVLAVSNPSLAADAVLDTLAAAEVTHGVVVFEDGHRVRDGAIYQLLDKIIERLPLGWCIALTSRVDPPLSLARLRVSGELEEFRAEDMRFSLAEAQILASQIRPAEQVAVEPLWQRTYGWPVGLYLALKTGHTVQAGWRADHHAFDYLASEVLEQLPQSLRQFLLRSAVLPELTATRCAAVSGDAHAATRLDELERRGLFVTVLESHERTMRLHDLFREFLDEHLQHYHGDELPGILQRAAAGETDPVRRVGYLVRAGDYDAAQQALVAATPAMLLNGAGAQVLRLLTLFPAALRAHSPTLAFVKGLHAWPELDWEPMRVAMGRAADGFAGGGLTAQAQQARAFEAMALLNLGRLEEAGERLRAIRAKPESHDVAVFGELLAYWYTGACGPANGPAQHLARMLDLLEQGGSPELWYRCMPHFLFLGRPGVNAQFARYAERALIVAGENHPHMRASANALKAWLLLFNGRTDEADTLIREAQEEMSWLGQPNNLRVVIVSLLGTLHAMHGERAPSYTAQASLVEIDRHTASNNAWRNIYLYHFSRWYVACDDWEAVTRIAELMQASPSTNEWPFTDLSRTGLAALLALRRGDYARSEALLEPILPLISDCDMFAASSISRVTLALAHARQGCYRAAWDVLAPALAAASATGGRLGLLIVGTTLLGELVAIRWNGVAPAAELELLEALAQQAAALRTGVKPSPCAPASGILSEREREVLEHLAAGNSNKLIARALDLSPHTVKRHVANILGKLNLDTRGQAAAWWHAQANPSGVNASP